MVVFDAAGLYRYGGENVIFDASGLYRYGGENIIFDCGSKINGIGDIFGIGSIGAYATIDSNG